MNNWQKIAVGTLAAIVWIATIVVGYLYPSLAGPMAEIKIAAIGVMNSVGIYHLVRRDVSGDTSLPDDPPTPAQPRAPTVPTTVTSEP